MMIIIMTAVAAAVVVMVVKCGTLTNGIKKVLWFSRQTSIFPTKQSCCKGKFISINFFIIPMHNACMGGRRNRAKRLLQFTFSRFCLLTGFIHSITYSGSRICINIMVMAVTTMLNYTMM